MSAFGAEQQDGDKMASKNDCICNLYTDDVEVGCEQHGLTYGTRPHNIADLNICDYEKAELYLEKACHSLGVATFNDDLVSDYPDALYTILKGIQVQLKAWREDRLSYQKR